MSALIAQLVAVACAELGLPPLVTSALVNAALQLAGQIPEAKLEAAMFAVMRRGAQWLITRPAGPEPTPDFGGNRAADFGSGPPVALRPEPDEGADLGENVRATFGDGPPLAARPEPEDGKDPGDPGT